MTDHLRRVRGLVRASGDAGWAAAMRASPSRRLLVTGVVAGLIVAGLVAAGGLAWWRHAQQRDEAHTWDVVAQAKDRTEQLLSYDSDHLDADLARGRAQATGNYAARYQRTVDDVIAPAARAGRIITLARVARAALVRAEPGRVETLLFVNQAVTGEGRPEPRRLTSEVLVTMSQVGDQWLISDLRPV